MPFSIVYVYALQHFMDLSINENQHLVLTVKEAGTVHSAVVKDYSSILPTIRIRIRDWFLHLPIYFMSHTPLDSIYNF